MGALAPMHSQATRAHSAGKPWSRDLYSHLGLRQPTKRSTFAAVAVAHVRSRPRAGCRRPQGRYFRLRA